MNRILLCKAHYNALWYQTEADDERECKFCNPRRANESKEEYEVRMGTRLWVGGSKKKNYKQ